jgi:hypothetical protein
MPFSNKRSWRLQFIDIDSSFSITEASSPINGYIAARAPKGTQRATYFTQNNEQAIDALMGVGSAHWPDLLEAKAYNQEYPIYISAPPGQSAAYPSYLGGFYITSRGLYKFYNVTDINELSDNTGNAFQIKVEPGKETEFDGDFKDKLSTITIGAPELTDFQSEDGVFKFEKTEDQYYIKLTKNRRLNVTAIDYDPMEDGLIPLAATITSYWGDNDPETSAWSFSGQEATLPNFGIKFGQSDTDRNALKKWLGEEAYDASIGDMNLLYALLRDGWITDESTDEVVSIPFGLQGIFSFKVGIRDETYAYFAQKSCTEIPTTIKISEIGYDKYRYDTLFPAAPASKADFIASKRTEIRLASNLTSGEEYEALIKKMKDNEYVAFYDSAKPQDGIFAIGQLNADDPDNLFYVDATANYITKYFSCYDFIDNVHVDNLYHKIFYIASADEIKKLMTEEESIAQFGAMYGPGNYEAGFAAGTSAPKNPTFNQITLSCSEEVYAGKTTSGGEFTGSLDELGKNTYGTENYLPMILQDDDVSFIMVRAMRKFGDNADDLDENGFWTHKRIVDPFDVDRDGDLPKEKVFTIEGDRYCTLVNTMNQLEMKTGGIYRDEYYQIIKDALIEGLLPEYDDVYLFMEPTGQEVFKSDLLALSNVGNKLAAVISPKILTPNNKGIFTDLAAQKIIVNGRGSMTSNAQYAGEFEYYDPVARKKYWCQPIGDIGKNIGRIFQLKYGGWAPAWTNISGGLGGQLGRSVLRSRYQFEDEATKTLDTKGINPIVFNSDYGLMIVSHRTTQDPTNMSDWCYLGHSLSFQLVKREIRDNVMIPQILKPINEYWMGIRQMQVDGILSKRTSGTSPIWASAVCDIAGQNTPYTKAQRNFVIRVTVKVNVFSETVTLILENVAQTM